jgi:hypothetical protein
MSIIAPGGKHIVTIEVKGPKDKAAIKKYMKAVRRAVGRFGKIKETKKRPATRAKRKSTRRKRGKRR